MSCIQLSGGNSFADSTCAEILVADIVYGLLQSDVSIIDRVLTSQIAVAALVCMDSPEQVAWHVKGLLRNGGTREQAAMTVDTARRVCEVTGIHLRKGHVDVNELLADGDVD